MISDMQTAALRPATIALIEAAYEVLETDPPMTLRQVHYRLVSEHIIDNNRN